MRLDDNRRFLIAASLGAILTAWALAAAPAPTRGPVPPQAQAGAQPQR